MGLGVRYVSVALCHPSMSASPQQADIDHGGRLVRFGATSLARSMGGRRSATRPATACYLHLYAPCLRRLLEVTGLGRRWSRLIRWNGILIACIWAPHIVRKNVCGGLGFSVAWPFLRGRYKSVATRSSAGR